MALDNVATHLYLLILVCYYYKLKIVGCVIYKYQFTHVGGTTLGMAIEVAKCIHY